MNKNFYPLIAAAALSLNGQAATVNQGQTDNAMIPDNDLNGIAETINIGNSAIQSISDVTIHLNISSRFNGDYYAYLLHDGVVSILLNRVGLNAANPYGASDLGLNVTLSDSAANGDIHHYPSVNSPHGGTLTGTWQPDARNVSPFSVSDQTTRDAFLSAFNGMSGEGAWTLFIADTSEGGIGTLDSWSIDVAGTGTTPIPETGETLYLLGAALLGIGVAQRITPRLARLSREP